MNDPGPFVEFSRSRPIFLLFSPLFFRYSVDLIPGERSDASDVGVATGVCHLSVDPLILAIESGARVRFPL